MQTHQVLQETSRHSPLQLNHQAWASVSYKESTAVLKASDFLLYLAQGWVNHFCKGTNSKRVWLCRSTVSVAITQLCYCRLQTDDLYSTNEWAAGVPAKSLFTKAGWQDKLDLEAVV